MRGATLFEALVACTLLTAVAVSVAIVNMRMKRAFQDRERLRQVWMEVSSARQTIGTWDFKELEKSRIDSLPISDTLKGAWPDIHWVSRIDSFDKPMDCRRVFVGLQWTQSEQRLPPLGLTFWVASPNPQQVKP